MSTPPEKTRPRRVVIMGAAGRDFHNFNMVFKNDADTHVVAFTAAQISGIAGRRYPPELSGPLYPHGIPIFDEAELDSICREDGVDEVVFAYSDVTHEAVMHAASRVLAAGADFGLLGPDRTMLSSTKPVIAVTAVRTGCGKSQVARHLSRFLRDRGFRVGVIRHPMPYGDLVRQRSQRFSAFSDLDAAECTNEEREEYEPHIESGSVVFAGVDYAAILDAAEKEADVILWDGGNNDFSFIKPDLHIVIADALRPGQMLHYHPGEAVLRMADIVVINKVNAAPAANVTQVTAEIRAANPTARIMEAVSEVIAEDPKALLGRRVVVIEDGPTITHGGAPHGAGYAAAKASGAVIVDPRPFAAPAIREVYNRYPHIGPVLPDVGYQEREREALRETIERSNVEAVLVAAPIDLKSVLKLGLPVIRVRYEYADRGDPRLTFLVAEFLARHAPNRG